MNMIVVASLLALLLVRSASFSSLGFVGALKAKNSRNGKHRSLHLSNTIVQPRAAEPLIAYKSTKRGETTKTSFPSMLAFHTFRNCSTW